MRRPQVAILFVALFMLAPGLVVPTEAEHEWDHGYSITGNVVDSVGNPAQNVTAMVDCSQGATDEEICGHNQGRNASTDEAGQFELRLHIHIGNDNQEIVLDIDGQEFNLTIDLKGSDGVATEKDRFIEVEFVLDHEVPYSAPRESESVYIMMWGGVILGGLFLLTAIILVVKNNASPKHDNDPGSAAPEMPAQLTPQEDPSVNWQGRRGDDGYEWLEHPQGSSIWFWRDPQTGQWTRL